MEQDPKQKDKNTQKDTAKGHAGLLPPSNYSSGHGTLRHPQRPKVCCEGPCAASLHTFSKGVTKRSEWVRFGGPCSFTCTHRQPKARGHLYLVNMGHTRARSRTNRPSLNHIPRAPGMMGSASPGVLLHTQAQHPLRHAMGKWVCVFSTGDGFCCPLGAPNVSIFRALRQTKLHIFSNLLGHGHLYVLDIGAKVGWNGPELYRT